MQDKPVFLTVIGVRLPLKVDAAAVSAALEAHDPARSYEVVPVPMSDRAENTGLVVNVEGVQFTVIPRAESVRAQSYASATRAAVLTWADAGEAIEGAGAQIIVAATQPAGDHAGAVKIAFLLTALTAAIASVTTPIFVYWGTADLLVEPHVFAAASQAMLRKNQPPVLQWVRFDLFRGPDTSDRATGGMRSKGLANFVEYELQLDPVSLAPVEIARRAVGYAEQLIREGPSSATEIDGPAQGERIRLTMHGSPGGALLRMRCDNLSVTEIN